MHLVFALALGGDLPREQRLRPPQVLRQLRLLRLHRRDLRLVQARHLPGLHPAPLSGHKMVMEGREKSRREGDHVEGVLELAQEPVDLGGRPRAQGPIEPVFLGTGGRGRGWGCGSEPLLRIGSHQRTQPMYDDAYMEEWKGRVRGATGAGQSCVSVSSG